MTAGQLALPTMRPLAKARDTDEWYTPPRYLALGRAVLGGIDLDPASSPKAQRTVQAGRYYTRADDGLAQRWAGRVWLNPPYSAPGVWTERLISEYEAGHVTAAILLVYNATDTTWFQPLWNYPICFKRGRIQFHNRPGRSNTRGSCFVYFGPHVERFSEVFGEIGAVVQKVPSKPASRA